jgi:hypothetical protein
VTVSTASTLHEVAQELLDTSETAVAATVGGPVALAYLSPGLPSLDYMCDQVAVWCAAITEEQTSPLSPVPQVGQRRRLGWTNLIVLSVLVARCVHVGGTTSKGYTPPKSSQLSSDADKVMEDGWALWNAISTAIIDAGLFGGTCQDIRFTSMIPLTPQGGLAGWTLTLTAELAGYR